MIPKVARRLLLATAILGVPGSGYAQEAVFTGTVADSTGGVLPGVTITALLEATGNTFVAVTDERGVYRLPARVGQHSVTAELQGFTTLVRQGIQLLVGQTLVVNLQMSPSTIEETVTVTAEAPLLNVDSSSLGGNIDPKQRSTCSTARTGRSARRKTTSCTASGSPACIGRCSWGSGCCSRTRGVWR